MNLAPRERTTSTGFLHNTAVYRAASCGVGQLWE
jgi:hypothetical protein